MILEQFDIEFIIAALDFVELMRGFYRNNPEFEGVPLYIYGQSYGGKMAIDMGIRIREVLITEFLYLIAR